MLVYTCALHCLPRGVSRAVQRKARQSIDMSNEEDSDYMMVVVSRKLSQAAFGDDFE